MDEITTTITNWPVIVQGALGSALFWLFLLAGQKFFDWAIKKLSFVSTNLRNENLYREYIQNKLPLTSRLHESLSICIYQALSYVLRGFVFLSLGLVISNFIPIGNIIGGIGFLFYVLRALVWLEPFTVGSKESEIKLWKKIKELEIKLFGEVKDDTSKKLDTLKAS